MAKNRRTRVSTAAILPALAWLAFVSPSGAQGLVLPRGGEVVVGQAETRPPQAQDQEAPLTEEEKAKHKKNQPRDEGDKAVQEQLKQQRDKAAQEQLKQQRDKAAQEQLKQQHDKAAQEQEQLKQQRDKAAQEQLKQQEKDKAAQQEQQKQKEKAAQEQQQKQLEKDKAAQQEQQKQKEKAAQEQLRQQQLEKDKAAQQEQQKQKEKAAQEQLRQQQLEKDKAAQQEQQKFEKDKAAQEEKQKQLEKDKAAQEEKQKQLEKEKATQEEQKGQQLEKDKAAQEELKRQELEKDKAAQEQQQKPLEKDKAAQEELKRQQLEKDKAAQEQQQKQLEKGKAAEEQQPQNENAWEATGLDDLKQKRKERVEEGGKRVLIEEPDSRVIIKENDRIIIQHDETERFRREAKEMHEEEGPGGIREIIFVRPDGAEIVTEVDAEGHLLRRLRREEGRDYVIIDNRSYYEEFRDSGRDVAFIDLPPPVIRIPREKYVVEYESASDADVYEALSAPPVEPIDRGYSLEQIRQSYSVRERMPRVDLDTINFEFGAWQVNPDQYGKLERVADAINQVLERNPNEVFLIEGHTDAVGSDVDNLSLSDRRAESVAVVLADTFKVPTENLVTQGYGRQFLKIRTELPERANRRVAVRRITPLMARAGDSN